MMRFHWCIARACIAIGASGSLTVHAQPSPPPPEALTLGRAVEIALDHHPSLRAAEASTRFSSATLTQAQAGYLPSLSASATAQRTDGAFVFNPSIAARLQTYNTYSTVMQLQQTVYDFGRTGGRVSADQNFMNASLSDYEGARDNVILSVQVTYYALMQSQQVEKVEEEAVDLAAAHLVQAKAFYSVGRRPQFDVTKAEVDLANARVNLIRARNQTRVASVQLENALGVHPAGGYAVRDTFSVATFEVKLDSALASAYANRPDLRAADARVQANKDLLTSAFGQHLPTLSAFGTWTWSNFNFPLYSRWNAGITFSLPIFQGFAVSAQVDQARANADEAQANYDLLKESVTLEVQQSYLGVRDAEEEIVAAAKLVEQAEQNLNLAEKQYVAGVGTPLDVTDAHASLSNARISRIQALFDYNSSLVRLQNAMGTIEQKK